MSIKRIFALCSVVIGAAGCAIRPLPENVTGYNTFQIVRKVRCEVRQALIDVAVDYIERRNPQIADDLRARRKDHRKFDRTLVDKQTQNMLEKYDQGAIAYDFSFDITEKSSVGVDIGALSRLSRGPLTIGFSLDDERERQNTRNFRVVDSFEKLIDLDRTVYGDDYCEIDAIEVHAMYPVAGSIGLKETIRIFIDLNERGNLAGKEKDPIPSMSDTIEFVTRVTGSANPKIELLPLAGRGLQLVSGGLSATAVREDIHKVIVALALPPDPTEREGVVLATSRPARAGPRRKTAVENRAVEELDFQLQRGFIVDTRRLYRRLRQATE